MEINVRDLPSQMTRLIAAVIASFSSPMACLSLTLFRASADLVGFMVLSCVSNSVIVLPMHR